LYSPRLQVKKEAQRRRFEKLVENFLLKQLTAKSTTVATNPPSHVRRSGRKASTTDKHHQHKNEVLSKRRNDVENAVSNQSSSTHSDKEATLSSQQNSIGSKSKKLVSYSLQIMCFNFSFFKLNTRRIFDKHSSAKRNGNGVVRKGND
jgi:hypothetical protein